jgi:catechol 2,3-dioxygenase-like lactoylglutathione lyase family enzyme
MKIKGLDRVVIMVRDMDKALRVFSEKFGLDFLELEKSISERDGVRSYVCHKTHLHLISPILPLPENAPPPMVKRMELLKQNEYIFMALTFKTDDPFGAGEELSRGGVRMQNHKYKKSHDYASIGMDDFEEVMTMDEDTFGLVIGLANYKNSGNTAKRTAPEPAISVNGLDRVIVMVRDMNKALNFFSGKLGLQFRETDKEVQMHAGNRGLVCHDAHIHLVQPNNPMPENAPPPLKMAAELLKKKEAMIMLFIFKVADAKKTSGQAKEIGLAVIRSWENDHDYAAVGMDNLYEYLFDPKDIFGMPICISTWNAC